MISFLSFPLTLINYTEHNLNTRMRTEYELVRLASIIIHGTWNEQPVNTTISPVSSGCLNVPSGEEQRETAVFTGYGVNKIAHITF